MGLRSGIVRKGRREYKKYMRGFNQMFTLASKELMVLTMDADLMSDEEWDTEFNDTVKKWNLKWKNWCLNFNQRSKVLNGNPYEMYNRLSNREDNDSIKMGSAAPFANGAFSDPLEVTYK